MDSEIMAFVKRVRSNLAQWRKSLDDSEQSLEQLFSLLRERDAEVVHLRARVIRQRQQIDERFSDDYPPEEVITAKIKVEKKITRTAEEDPSADPAVPIVEGVLAEGPSDIQHIFAHIT